jgi:hypothetical protein
VLGVLWVLDEFGGLPPGGGFPPLGGAFPEGAEPDFDPEPMFVHFIPEVPDLLDDFDAFVAPGAPSTPDGFEPEGSDGALVDEEVDEVVFATWPLGSEPVRAKAAAVPPPARTPEMATTLIACFNLVCI